MLMAHGVVRRWEDKEQRLILCRTFRRRATFAANAMDHLEQPATDKTPFVLFDPARGTLEIRGCSIHENADRFFGPLIDTLEAYIRTPAPRTHARIALTYFNSSSAKYMLDLLKVLDELHARGGRVEVEWLHEADDLDMQETGEDLRALLDLPMKVVPID